MLARTLGGLGGVNWETLWLPELAVLLGIGVLLVQARNLNLPPAGEEATRRDRPVRRGRHPHRRSTPPGARRLADRLGGRGDRPGRSQRQRQVQPAEGRLPRPAPGHRYGPRRRRRHLVDARAATHAHGGGRGAELGHGLRPRRPGGRGHGPDAAQADAGRRHGGGRRRHRPRPGRGRRRPAGRPSLRPALRRRAPAGPHRPRSRPAARPAGPRRGDHQLAVRHQLDVLDVLRRLSATVLLAPHDLNLAAYCCDRPHVLREGRSRPRARRPRCSRRRCSPTCTGSWEGRACIRVRARPR